MSTVYQPLEASLPLVRILILEAGVWESPIRCDLRTECLDDQPDYDALSYVWGGATLRRQISVDGAKLEITASLDCALRHLRDQSRLLRVWADGICINQNDFEDRNIKCA